MMNPNSSPSYNQPPSAGGENPSDSVAPLSSSQATLPARVPFEYSSWSFEELTLCGGSMSYIQEQIDVYRASVEKTFIRPLHAALKDAAVPELSPAQCHRLLEMRRAMTTASYNVRTTLDGVEVPEGCRIALQNYGETVAAIERVIKEQFELVVRSSEANWQESLRVALKLGTDALDVSEETLMSVVIKIRGEVCDELDRRARSSQKR
jgi:hypothetical protein